MTIVAKHFDVRLNKWIHIDNNEDNQESLLQEKISNTLLERFLPDKEFSFGHMDAEVTAKQLENHPNGDKLLLSSKTRLLYGSEDCLNVINQLCPDRKDRGAYGSIFLGGCRTAIDTELNVLVVDDANGDNGGIIDNDQAYKLTGDCYGQIADDVYRQLTGHENGDKYRVIQYRFGWTPEDGNDDSFRFGKGTFRPTNLNESLQYNSQDKPKIDVIIPISSFKGTDKDNPDGATKPQIKPGLYKQKVWIGEKSQSELGKTAISQVLASFPKGIKDFSEKIELEAQKLAKAEKDPRKLAQLYCEKYEKRKDYLENEADELENEINQEFDEDKHNNIAKLRDRLENDSFIYKVIKADLAGDSQLIETEKVKNELTKFVQGEWRDIAIGKKLQFERALVIPSKDLKNGEIFIPKYNEGEEVLNFRSPFLNSNGMCVSTNKTVNDALGPDGKKLEGIIIVSDETSERIYKRLSEQIEKVLPSAIAQGVEIDGIKNYLNQGNYGKLEIAEKINFTDELNGYIKNLNDNGFDIKQLPYESEQERQARDYDGDCVGFERANKYPNLTAEAIERNLPENAYEPTVKLKKASFYDEEGEQPSFETIAKHMSDGISVGIINNHLTSIEALESEMEVIKEYGSIEMQAFYVINISNHYEGLFRREDPEKESTLIPDKYRGYMQEVVEHAASVKSVSDNSQASVLQAMDANKTMYRELIADAAYQNQIAVDLFKSATTPDIASINQNSRLLHRNVNYIKDKKKSSVYDTETIDVNGYSPVELLIAKTNQYFRSSQLESRPLSQFQSYFKDIEYTNQQRMSATLAKKEFDTAFNAATRFSKRRETEKSPSIKLKLASEKELDVSNLLGRNNQEIWNAKSINVRIIPVSPDKINSSRPHKFAVYAQVDGQVDKEGKPKFSRLGNISKEQEFNLVKETGIEFNQTIEVKSHEFQPALSEGQVKLLFNQAYDIATKFYESIPDEEKVSMAAATWAISTTRESTPKDSEIDEVDKEIEKAKKVSNFVFAAFENEIIERTNELQLESTKVIKFNKDSAIFQSDTEVRYNVDSNGKDIIEAKNDAGEYETFAELEAQASRLSIGTTATAKAEFNEIYTATATTQIPGKPPVEFNISELIKYDLGQQQFNGEQVQLQIQCIDRAQEDYVIYTKDKQGRDIKVGKIDDNSVQEGIAEGWLERAPKQGQNLKLKLTQIASGQNGYAVGETPDGNAIRINLDKNFKENNIKDTDYRDVIMKAHGTKNVYMAAINGRVLGKIGVLPSKGRIPKSLDTLMKAGIVRGGQKVTTIPATIQSNQTTANVTLDKETIEYPKEWVKRHQILNTNASLTSQEEANNEVLKQINTRPTLLFQDNKQKQSGLLGLAIDESRAKNTKLFLDKKGIEYEEMPRSRAKQEARKGMVALVLNESSISKDMMDILIERANGVILNNDQPKQDISINPQRTVYFVDPNQEYGEGEKGVVGFVVPNKNVEAVGEWLNSKNIGVNYIENGNTTIVLATAKSIESDTIDELNQALGTPIDTSTVEGFDKYEADTKKLNETKPETMPSAVREATIALVCSVQYNEYQSTIRQLPNRPKNLAEEEASQLPFAPASPLNNELAKVQIEVEDKIANQAPINEKAEVYRLIQNDRANMPPGSAGIDIVNSPVKAGVIVNLESHKLLNYNQQSTVLAVDFEEVEKTRNLLQDKSIEFDEAIGINYVYEDVDPLTKLMSEKGYYTFIIKDEDISSQDLNEIKNTTNVQHTFDIFNDNLVELEGGFKDFAAQQPNVDKNIKTAISQYIENKDLFLDEWNDYIKSNTEQYINVQHLPTKNVVELIERVPSLSQEKLNIEAAKLNIIEASWVKLASESNKDVPSNKEGQEWNDFVKEAFVDNFDKLASRSEYFSSVGVEKVKQIIQLEEESSQSLDGEVLEKVDELKRQLVESYGENSYKVLENKARKQIEKKSQSIAQLKFKGIHDNSNNQNYGGIEIENDNKLVGFSQKLGEGTSQQAEYQALIFGLEKAKEIGIANINIASDSQNIILQLEGKNEVRSEGLKPLYERVKELIAGFDVVQFEQLPKLENECAKSFAKKAAQENRVKEKISTRHSGAVRVTNNLDENSSFNKEQKEAYQKIIRFLQRPNNGDQKKNEFLLTGYAGTGKTYTLIKTLEENRNLNICFTAPTNSAVKVLRKMSRQQGLNIDSKTTHSLLGLKEKYDKTTGEIFYDNDKKNKREKFLDYDAIIVDEGSMVNKQLREKLEEVAQRGVKVIYMGDIAQLPPVNENQSLIFDIEDCANLKEVMRYGGDIARIAEAIRNDLKNPNPSPILSSEDGQVVRLNKEQFKEEISNLFNSEEFKQDNSSVKVLAYTNKRVDEINAFVKEQVFGKDSPEYLEGIRLIARAPVVEKNGTELEILLHNSDEITINNAVKIVENGYKTWELTGINEENNEVTFKTVAEESKDKFNSDIQKLFSIENKKPPQERDYAMICEYKGQYADVRPAYAITVHNSQGKTIVKGAVDEKNINIRLEMALKETDPEERQRGIEEHQKLRYVAMTRFESQVYVHNDGQERNIGVENKLEKARAALGKNDGVLPSPTKNTQQVHEWARYAPKGKEAYEISSAGDSRFSALNAKLQDGRTIEEAYQLDIKGYRAQGNDWRLGKGKAPLTPMTRDEQYQKYKDLWKQWSNENTRLMDGLKQVATGRVLTDQFASTDISQARALAEILDERTTQPLLQSQVEAKAEPIVLASSKEANKNVPIEIMGKLSDRKVEELRSHLEDNYKPLMDNDKSNYAPGRQVAWINAKWELKDKDFSAGIEDNKLMELIKQVYPDADIALVTYSEQEGQGIDYHRDDSYAAAEARSINIGDSMWGYQASKEGMKVWDPNANDNAPIQEFKLESGTVTRFNSKNPHAALETSAGRWSINVWSIKNDLGKDNSVREKFDKFQASNQTPTAVVETKADLTIKSNEWTPCGEIKVKRRYSDVQSANTAGIIRLGNAVQSQATTPNIPTNPQISGKPIPMTWELNQPPELKGISTTIDAMRGLGRVHSTRAQNYYQTYGIKEGDIAIAQGKDNKQVAFRVGKQYKITQAMIDNPDYQRAWVNWEKHSVKELTENQAAKGKHRQLYGLFMEPLGDYQNGKIIPFEKNQQQERTLNITFDGASRNNGKPDAQAAAAAVLINPEGRVKEFSQYLGNKTNNEAEFQAAIVGMKAAQEFGYKSIKIQGDSQLVIEALQGNRNIKAENLKPLYQEAVGLLQSFDKAEVSYIPREQNKAADALANKALDNASLDKNPIANLEPVSEATAKHMVKDKAMAEVATQYIGISAAPPDTQSSTRNYAQAWSDKANTGSYINKDVIMVSGSGPWRGVTQNQIEETFKNEYIPLLDKAIAAYSDIIVGNAAGTDKLVQDYLQQKGYKLEQTPDNYARLSSRTKEINSPQIAKEVNNEDLIISSASTGLGAVLTNATNFAKKSGKLENDYQVSVNGNPEAPQGKYGLETHDFKPAGVPYNSAEHAYVHQSQINPDKDPYKVMIEVLQAKLEQHPRLANTITKKGGIKYLENAQIVNEQDKQWEGKGKESKFIRALTEAYTNITEKSSQNNSKDKAPPQANQSNSTEAVDVSKSVNEPSISPGIIISSRSKSPLGAALTSTTVKSKQIGSIDKDYPVSFRDNAELAKGSYGPETYTSDKPAGEPFASVEQAYYVYKETVKDLGESRVNLLAEIQQARFEQHPELIEKVKENGGVDWLKECTYKVGGKNNFWEGKGEESPYLHSLIKGYENAVQINKQTEKTNVPPTDKVDTSERTPQESPAVEINKPQVISETAKEEQIPAFGTMDSILERARSSTLEMLSNWQEIAQKLGKNEEYLHKISENIETYKNEGLGLENSFLAMAKDIKELEKLNDVTRMVHRVANTVGKMDNNNVLSIKTTHGYQFSIASSDKNLLVRDKKENDSKILLYIKEGEVKVNKINDNFVKDLKMMNFTIDNALSNVKEQLVV